MRRELFGPANVSRRKLTSFEKEADRMLSAHLEDQILQDATCGCGDCMRHAKGKMEERLITKSPKHVDQGLALFVNVAMKIRQMKQEDIFPKQITK